MKILSLLLLIFTINVLNAQNITSFMVRNNIEERLIHNSIYSSEQGINSKNSSFLSAIILGSLKSNKKLNIKSLANNDKVKINIELLNDKIIKGQLIDILVKVKNNSSDTIRLDQPEQYLFSFSELQTINSVKTSISDGQYYLILPPNGEYVYIINPLKFIIHREDNVKGNTGYPWFYWREGNYSYCFSFNYQGKEYISNKIDLTIQPVPDSLKTAFEDLKDDIKNSKTITQYEYLYDKYQNTLYEKEFLSKILSSFDYFFAIKEQKDVKIPQQKAKELYKKFILNYPDSEESFVLLNRIYGYRNYGNEDLLKEISNSLKNNKKGEKLLRVLDSQKKYRQKELNKYGF